MDSFAAFLDMLLPVGILIVAAILVRSAVIFTGQTWIRTFSHSVTLVLLPIVTYAVTSVISGNIALSLGMVGALSIVRFRNPVKSPFELVIYFLMISCGITAAVSMSWLVLLTAVAVGALVAVGVADRIWRRRGGEALFTVSFSEGNSLNTLEVHTDREFRELLGHAELISFVRSPEGNLYRFASRSREPLLQLNEALDGHDHVTRVAFSAA